MRKTLESAKSTQLLIFKGKYPPSCSVLEKSIFKHSCPFKGMGMAKAGGRYQQAPLGQIHAENVERSLTQGPT